MDSQNNHGLLPRWQLSYCDRRTVNAISIVIPAYNEQDSIADTVERCFNVLRAMQLEAFEVIVIDDGSKDRTGEIATEMGAIVRRHPANAGYGRSLKDGILSARYDTIAITDADGTYPVEAIPQMVEEYRKGVNLVVGRRTGENYHESALKMPMRRILKFLVEFAAGTTIPDINSGLRLFSKSEILPYFSHLCETFSFTTSQTLAYLMTSKYASYIDIAYGARVGQSKVRLLRDSLRTLQYIVLAILYYNPIKIFIIMSCLCIGIGMLSAFIGLLTHIMAGYYLGIGCILISVLVFCLGLLAEQLRQLFLRE